MVPKRQRQKSHEPPRFRIGDRVSLRLGAGTSFGTIVEDRGLLGAGRRLFRVKVDFDPPNVTFIELPEDELTAVQ
jgi:hypothetical protein